MVAPPDLRVKAGLFQSPPSICATTCEIAARDRGVFQPRGEGGQVHYALPGCAAPELKAFLGAQASADFPPPFLARLPGGRVFGSGNVLSSDGNSIARDVSLDFGKPFGDHWLLGYEKIPPPIQLPGCTAVVATTLGGGYGHWLLEELPRLIAIRAEKNCDAIIAHGMAVYAREAMVGSGFTGELIEARRGKQFACEELMVPSVGRIAPDSLRMLEEFTSRLPRVGSLLGEKLYICRSRARRRKIANEAELWAGLAGRGFERVFLEDLTWSQQMAAFRAARVIVAPHGAGLANLVFAKPGAQVVELFNRAYVNGCYWQLAALRQLDYCPVISPGSELPRQQSEANRSDIEADLPAVWQALTAT